MATQPQAVDATFRVGARIHTRVGPLNGGGTLTIGPGKITLAMGRVTRAVSPVSEVVHVDPSVILVKARLLPPWFNTALLLRDGDRSASAVTWFRARPRLRAALREAGFAVDERSTWFATMAPRQAP